MPYHEGLVRQRVRDVTFRHGRHTMLKRINHTDTEQAVFQAYPELQRLHALCESGGWCFQPVLVANEVELLTGARTWPHGWSDAIAIRDLSDAKAFRCDPDGGEVWQREGGLAEVIDGLLELPPPDQPGAPRLVKAKAAKLWTPGDKLSSTIVSRERGFCP